MEVTKTKLLYMAATIMAGAMANPANGALFGDSYSQQVVFGNILNGLQQSLLNAGMTLVDK